MSFLVDPMWLAVNLVIFDNGIIIMALNFDCFVFRDVDWPRDCICADGGGASAHLSHSHCWFLLQLVNYQCLRGWIRRFWCLDLHVFVCSKPRQRRGKGEKLKDDVHLLLFIYHIIDRLAESVFCPKNCRWASSPRHWYLLFLWLMLIVMRHFLHFSLVSSVWGDW